MFGSGGANLEISPTVINIKVQTKHVQAHKITSWLANGLESVSTSNSVSLKSIVFQD